RKILISLRRTTRNFFVSFRCEPAAWIPAAWRREYLTIASTFSAFSLAIPAMPTPEELARQQTDERLLTAGRHCDRTRIPRGRDQQFITPDDDQKFIELNIQHLQWSSRGGCDMDLRPEGFTSRPASNDAARRGQREEIGRASCAVEGGLLNALCSWPS